MSGLRPALPPRDVAAVMAVTVLWGLNFAAIKLATADIPPFLLAALRFAIVGMVLAPFHPLPVSQIKRILPIAGLLGIGHFGFLFLGMYGADTATGSVVVQMGAPFSVLLAWAVLGDRPGLRRLAGIALAMAGVALLAGAPGHPGLWSVAALLFAELCWATAMLFIKRLEGVPPLALNGWMALLCAPGLLAASVLTEHNQIQAVTQAGPLAWAGLGYIVVGASLVAYSLWYALLARHPISLVAPFTLLSPVVAFAAGGLYLDERITVVKVIGGILTVVGVAIVELRAATPTSVEAGT